MYESDESEPSTNRPARKLMDLVILDRDITLSEEKKFTKFTRGYCLFATENVQMLNSATSRYFKARMGQYLYTGDVQYFLAHEVRNYYPNPYGEKFNPAKLAISDSFTGRVSCEGNYNLLLEGEFGEDFSQIAYWRYNIPVFEGQCIDMYLEYEKTGDVEIKLRLFQFYYGSIGDIKQVWELDEEQLQDVFCIDNESDQGPVFVSTDTDLFSRLLIEKNIPHNVLNASNAFWEAQIIAGAGQMNAVTVATTMAGRGTDIKLGDGVKELGGLAVIGIGRMNNSRSERQARGRAGRQGDPGFSQYYVSLEDDIVGAEDDDKLQRYIDGKKRIGKRKIKRIVNQCQKLSVESEEMNRKKSLQYDQVLQRQRDLIYATRKNLLDGASVEQEKIVGIAKENISDFVNHFDCIQSNKKHGRRRGRKKDSDKNTNTQQYTSMLNRYILDNISYKLDAGLSKSDMQSAATVSDYLMLRVYQGLSRQRERIGDEEAYEQFVREATLKAVDDGWVELIDYLEQLKYAVAGRASAQRNVMFEYQNEAFESFLDTEKAVKCNIIRNILLSDVKIGKDGRLQVIYP